MNGIAGYLTEIVEGEGFSCFVPYQETWVLERQQMNCVEVHLKDNRVLSPEQRRKIFALVDDITEYVRGLDKKKRTDYETLCELELAYVLNLADNEQIRRQLTFHYCTLRNMDLFSLSQRSPDTIDMTTARDFIDWMVELCILHGIPCIDTLLNRCEGVGRYLYACLLHKRCALCGVKAELHHVDAVGMGRNRKEIIHEGMEVLSLCRTHHTEFHSIGKESFFKKYHVFGIKLDTTLCKIWGLKSNVQV